MKIGDTEITRDDMPAMEQWKLNPDHIRQGFQDLFAGMTQQLQPPQQPPQYGTAEERGTQW